MGVNSNTGGLDSGTLIGIIVSVVIAGIGAVVMLLKGRKDAANAARQQLQNDMIIQKMDIFQGGQMLGQIKAGPTEANDERVIANPVYEQDESASEKK